MIALVGVPAPPTSSGGTKELGALPEPPGSRYTAFAVHCREGREVRDALDWYRIVLDSRGDAPLGLIARDSDCVRHLVRLDHSLVFLMDPVALAHGRLPVSALQALREAGIEGRILEEVVREYGPAVLSEQESLKALIARAVAGSTIGRAASDLGIHPDTLARRLNGVGVAPRWLRQWARLRAYELRVELGTDGRIALGAGGWTHHEQRRKAMARLGQAGQLRSS